jgi:hypothetical protein
MGRGRGRQGGLKIAKVCLHLHFNRLQGKGKDSAPKTKSRLGQGGTKIKDQGVFA